MADSVTSFLFARLDEPWQVGVLLAMAALAAWAAWRWYGPRAPGAAGFIARCARSGAMALLVLLLGWPALSRTDTSVLPGSLAVAIDTSASMARADGPGGGTRLAAGLDLLQRLRSQEAARRMRLSAYVLDQDATQLPEQPAADGGSSPLGDAIATLALERRPDVLVAVSDGRVTAGSTLAATAERLRGRDVRLLILATGGQRLDAELFIDEVAVNREVALDELEPVTVRLSARALPAGTVRLELLLDGAVVDKAELTVPADASPERAELHALEARLGATFRSEGAARIQVRAIAGPIVRTQELGVTVAERRLGVLLLDRAPRYEVRYLREALRRDSGANLHAYLADGRWRRWGADGPDHLPLTQAELAAYDAIIIGDLGPEAFRDVDLQAIANHVRRAGAGLVVIPGETGASAGLMRSALAELMPAILPDATAVARGFREQRPHRLARTPLAEALGLLDSGGVPWAELAPLLGAAPCEPRPGAEILAADQDGVPLVVARAAGSGRAVLVCADDAWRWRRGVGDRYLHRFHSQLLRYAAAGRRAGARPWRLTASPRRVSPGEAVAIDLSPAPGVEVEVPDQASVRLSGPDGSELVVALTRRGRGFVGRVSAPTAGTWTAGVAAGPAPDRVEPGELLVVPSEDERRDPRADRIALQALADATGGQVFDDPAALLAALPRDLGRAESTSTERGLWDTWWALAAIVALLAIDWSIRRHYRLP
jgi:uncharacterized membrane protein